MSSGIGAIDHPSYIYVSSVCLVQVRKNADVYQVKEGKESPVET